MTTPSSSQQRVRALLVVEDNIETQQLITLLLQDRYQVEVASGYDRAVQMAGNRLYDFVLIDIHLSERRTGSDLLAELRQLPNYDRVPFIACTAYALPGDSRRFLDIGFNAYLGKPFRKAQLLKILDELSDSLPG